MWNYSFFFLPPNIITRINIMIRTGIAIAAAIIIGEIMKTSLAMYA